MNSFQTNQINAQYCQIICANLLLLLCYFIASSSSVCFFSVEFRKFKGKHLQNVDSITMIPCPQKKKKEKESRLPGLTTQRNNNVATTNYRKLWEIILTCVECYCIQFQEFGESKFNVYGVKKKEGKQNRHTAHT